MNFHHFVEVKNAVLAKGLSDDFQAQQKRQVEALFAPLLAANADVESLKEVCTALLHKHKVMMAEDLTAFYKKHDETQVKDVAEVAKKAYIEEL